VHAEASQMLIVEGAQHGIANTLRSLTNSGDTVLADSVTYQGINALCRSLGLILVGVDADSRGMSPDALRLACTEHQPRLLFLVPSIHNPTAITLVA
ncbi:aminotransferase class I/II-fold pyridoxal phosphate-dependent enzyme, partial [Pseudomonas brassicacearum]|uniref:aminotransferase class I/II-fold pyridoxal phosphate-dependent enzyme n=1 Tax=Pseudomonas brassicacearum TaxID=930166 RepID=UPI000F46B121